jgi:hypothetical protein
MDSPLDPRDIKNDRRKVQQRTETIKHGVALFFLIITLWMYWTINWSGPRTYAKQCFAGTVRALYPKTSTGASGEISYDMKSATPASTAAARTQYYTCLAISGIDIRSMPQFEQLFAKYEPETTTQHEIPELIPIEAFGNNPL